MRRSPAFRDSIAIDQRIKNIVKNLGVSGRTFQQYEEYFQNLASDAGLKAWEADRLLYDFNEQFLTALDLQRRAHRKNRVTKAGCR